MDRQVMNCVEFTAFRRRSDDHLTTMSRVDHSIKFSFYILRCIFPRWIPSTIAEDREILAKRVRRLFAPVEKPVTATAQSRPDARPR